MSLVRARVLDDDQGAERPSRAFTLQDQIAIMRPLGIEHIAALCGYASGSSLTTLRWRGRLIPPHRLHFAGARLEAMAIAIREMARATPRKRVTKIRPELYADLGLVLSDEEAKPR